MNMTCTDRIRKLRLLLPGLLLAVSGHVLAAGNPAIARTVAGILHYADWPVSHVTPRLCVVGQSPHATFLGQSHSLPAHWNSEVLQLDSDDPALPARCQALYIGALSQQAEQRLFKRILGQPILSISEQDPACVVGSLFCLHETVGTVRFQINLDSVARSKIRIHPKVLLLEKLREPAT